MDRSNALLSLLASQDGDWVDVALCEVMDAGDPAIGEALVDQILQRGHHKGLVGLLERFSTLGDSARQRLQTQVPRMETALRQVARHGTSDARLGVIEIIRRAKSPDYAYILVPMMHVNDGAVHREAAAAMLRLVQTGITEQVPIETGLRYRTALTEAVAEACACYHQHRRRDVLAAALWLTPYWTDEIAKHLIDRKAGAHLPICELLSHPSDAAVAGALLWVCRIVALQPAVIGGLGSTSLAVHLDKMMVSGHLLMAPEVRQCLRRVANPDHLLPDEMQVGAEPAAVARQMARWVGGLPLPSSEAMPTLSALAAHGDRTVRLSAMRALLDIPSDSSSEVLASLCFDPELTIARIALRALTRREWSGLSKLLVKLVGSEHEEIRRIAEERIGQTGFIRFWVSWDKADQAKRVQAGRALMKIDPRFSEKLDRKLVSTSVADRFRAVAMVRELGQASYHLRALIQLAEDEDDHVASSAAKALGDVPDSDPAWETLKQMIQHPDDRVSANAIEAVEAARGSDDVRDELEEVGDGRNHRARATAIKALLNLSTPDAMAKLAGMLQDDDPQHRTSALWVIEDAGVQHLIEQVAQVAKSDPDEKLRRRALGVLRQIVDAAEAERRAG